MPDLKIHKLTELYKRMPLLGNRGASADDEERLSDTGRGKRGGTERGERDETLTQTD